MEYIQGNYDKDLNMAVVSNYIFMNYSLFSYLFKKYTKSNFVNYLKWIRMEEAKRLLTETDLRINEISHKVGYDNEKISWRHLKVLAGCRQVNIEKMRNCGKVINDITAVAF